MKIVHFRDQLSLFALGGGPSKFARFDGVEFVQVDGHGMQMSLYKRIFTETRADVALEMHAPVTAREVLAEARVRVRKNRYEPDKKAYQVENSGALLYEGVQEFTVVDGQARFLNPDGSVSDYSFETFHERQLNDPDPIVRSKYSHESHMTDKLLSEVIVNSEKPVELTKIAHDSRGIRDAYTYVYDPKTNKGSIRIQNIAQNGKNMSPSEAIQKMRETFVGRQEIRLENNVTILVKSEQTNKTDGAKHSFHRVMQHTSVETQVQIERAVFKETRATLQSIDGYLYRVNGKNLKDTPRMIGNFLVQRVQRIIGSPHKILAGLHEFRSIQKRQDVDVKEPKSIERRLRKRAQHNSEVIVWVNEKKSRIEKNISQHERKAVKVQVRREGWKQRADNKRMQRLSLREATHQLVKKINTLDKITMRKRTEFRSAAMVKKDVKERKLAVTEKIIYWKRKGVKETVKRRRKEPAKNELVTSEKLIRLVVIARKLIRRKERMLAARIKKPETTRVQSAEKKQKAKEQLLNFSIAFIFWTILNRTSLISQSKRFHLSIHESKIVRRKEDNKNILFKQHKIEGLELKEPIQWILLAIIWYLVMIREQGYVKQQQPKQKRAKKKTYYPQFAPQGVIFAYAT